MAGWIINRPKATITCSKCKARLNAKLFMDLLEKWNYCPYCGADMRAEQTEPQTYVINPQEPTNMPKCFDCEDFFTCDGQCEIECEKCKHFREEADTYTKQCEFYFMECKYEPKNEPQTERSNDA